MTFYSKELLEEIQSKITYPWDRGKKVIEWLEIEKIYLFLGKYRVKFALEKKHIWKYPK